MLLKRFRFLDGVCFALCFLSFVLSASGVQVANSSFDDIENEKPVGWSFKGTGFKALPGVGCNGSPGVVWESAEPSKAQAGVGQELTGWETGVEYEFSAQVRAENFKTPGYKGICMCIEWFDAAGKCLGGGYFASANQPSSWSTIRDTTKAVPTNAVKLSVYPYIGEGSSGKVFFDEITVKPRQLVPVEYLCSDAYRDLAAEGRIQFAASIHTPKPLRGKTKGTFRYRSAEGSSRAVPAETLTDEEAIVRLDVADLAIGEQTVAFELEAEGKTLGSASLAFTRVNRLPERRVWIDRHNRCIVDGKPFFPLGMYFGDVTKEELDIYAEGPFNCLMSYSVLRGPQLDLCEKAGIKAFASFQGVIDGSKNARKYDMDTPDKVDAFFADRIMRQMNHPAVLGWYLFDEVSQSTIPAYRRVLDLIRKIDDQHPVWGVYHRNDVLREYVPICDVLGVDPYPIPTKPAGSVTDFMRLARKAVFGNRVMWNVPQMFNWEREDIPNDRYPTEEELRSMLWQFIADGSNGLIGYSFHWMHNEKRKSFADFDRDWAKLCKVVNEVKKMVPVILSVDPTPPLKVSTSDAVCRAWAKDGLLYVVVCNAVPKTIEATVSIASGKWAISGHAAWNPAEMADARTVCVTLPENGVSLVRLKSRDF